MCAIAADADPIRAKLDTAKKVYTEAIAMHGKELLDTLLRLTQLTETDLAQSQTSG